MSEDNKPVVVEEPISDFSDRDMRNIQRYVDEGLPGIATVDADKMARIMDMYLSGKTYRQIAQTMSMDKAMVLYLSHKFNWFIVRREYLVELESLIRNRIIESKIVQQDFLLQLTQMWEKKIGTNIKKYLATDNEEFANNIDLKEVDKYLKTVEILHRLGSEKSAGGSGTPAVGLNVGDGVTIVKKSDNEVEITPKSKAIGDVLKALADERRENEAVKKK